MKAASILDTIGNTPHIRVNRLFGANAEVWIKSERANPGASIKDRIALAGRKSRKSGKLNRRTIARDFGQYGIGWQGCAVSAQISW